MKKNFMKKALAVTLSAAMAFSLSSVNMMTASAAVHVVKTKKLTVGVKKKLKLKSNALGWKITKAKSNKTAVCKISKKAKGYVTLNPVKKGTAKITLTIKRKKPNKTVVTKKLVCKVTVQNAAPDNPNQPGNDDPVVDNSTASAANQDELNAALQNPDLRKLTIATNESDPLEIPVGDYKLVDLTVNAPNATITNYGQFKSISIAAIAEKTWIEEAVGNILDILAPKGHIVVGKNAKTGRIKFSAQQADVTLDVNGSVEAVEVNAADTKVTVGGETSEAVPVVVNAANADVTATTKVTVTASVVTGVKLTFEKGAEGSEITVKVAGKVTLDVTNKTDEPIAVTNNDGEKQAPIAVGAEGPVTVESKVEDPANPSNPTNPGSTTNPSVSTDDEELKDIVIDVDTLCLENIKAEVLTADSTTGSATIVSGDAVQLRTIKVSGEMAKLDVKKAIKNADGTIKEYTTVSGEAIKVQYQVYLKYTNKDGDKVTKSIPADKFIDTGKSITETTVTDVDAREKATILVTCKVVKVVDDKVVAEGVDKSAEKPVISAES